MPAAVLLAAAALLPAAESGAGWSKSSLNNEGLVMLARAGYNERFLLDLLRHSESKFDTSVEGLVYLARNGLSERVVRAVLGEEQARIERERRQPSGQDAPAWPATGSPGAAVAQSPVRLKVVKQKVLVPEAGQSLSPAHVIFRESGWMGDRWYAIPAPAPAYVAAGGR